MSLRIVKEKTNQELSEPIIASSKPIKKSNKETYWEIDTDSGSKRFDLESQAIKEATRIVTETPVQAVTVCKFLASQLTETQDTEILSLQDSFEVFKPINLTFL